MTRVLNAVAVAIALSVAGVSVIMSAEAFPNIFSGKGVSVGPQECSR